jgi:branched-chain amino acid transport system permease protein
MLPAPLVQSIFSGLLLGSIYALMALGLTLIYGTLRMLNLSHGALFMLGGYVAWVAISLLGLPVLVGLLLAFVLISAIGLSMYPVIINPLLRAPGWEMTTIIATLGLSIVFENAALLIFGPRRKAVPAVIEGHTTIFSGVVVTYHELVVIGVAVASLITVWIFLKRSRHGLAVIAVAQNRDAAYLMGVSVYRIFGLVLAVSSGMAAIGGVLLSSFYFLSPPVGGIPQLKALLIIILGGLGSIKGTIHAAYIVGLMEALVSLYFGAKWALPALFIFMMMVLIVRPSGLYGMSEEVRL